MNPFSKLRTTIRKKLGKNTPDPSPPSEDFAELRVIWPDGTWKKPWHNVAFAEMDEVARGAILDCWANEEFLTAQELAGFDLNPGMFGGGVEAIRKGWRPSEKILKLLFARHSWAVELMHYMVAEMTKLKTIRP